MLLAWSLGPIDSADTDLFWHLADGQRIFGGHGVEASIRSPGRITAIPGCAPNGSSMPLLYLGWMAWWDRPADCGTERAVCKRLRRDGGHRLPSGPFPTALMLATVGAAEIASRYYPIRPHLLTLLLLAICFWLLESTRNDARVRWCCPRSSYSGSTATAARSWDSAWWCYTSARCWLEAVWKRQERPPIPGWLLLGASPPLMLTPQPGRNFLYPLLFTLASDGWQIAIGEFAPLNLTSPQETWFLIYLALAWLGAALAVRKQQPLDLMLTGSAPSSPCGRCDTSFSSSIS